MTDRLMRDGRVAVLYSPGHGAGWSTWCHSEDGTAEAMMFDPVIADIVDQAAPDWQDRAMEVAMIKYPDQYLRGLEDAQVAWLLLGTQFRITEYDGSESIEIKDDIAWYQA